MPQCKTASIDFCVVQHSDLKQALHEALERLETEWLKQARVADEPDGTCVAVVIIAGNKLIAASIGDSEMVLDAQQRHDLIRVFHVGSLSK